MNSFTALEEELQSAPEIRNAKPGDITGPYQALQRLLAKHRCRKCGCSQDQPCPSGCTWVPGGLCSRCASGTAMLSPKEPPAAHGVQLLDGMGEEETTFRHRAELSIYHGGGLNALVIGRDVIYGEDGIPRVSGGWVITREQVDQLIRGIQRAAPLRTVLPPNVVMWDGLRVAWWVPSARRRIWFNPRRRPELQHVNRKEVLHPPLLLVAEPGHLAVWALAENERPSAATPIYQAPYPNVYDTGGVCAGGVAWPKTLDLDRLPEWEKAWFDSEGTYPTTPRLTLHPGGHVALWTAMLTAEAFPAESLVPLGLTVLDAINHSHRPYTGPFVKEEIVPELPALEESK